MRFPIRLLVSARVSSSVFCFLFGTGVWASVPPTGDFFRGWGESVAQRAPEVRLVPGFAADGSCSVRVDPSVSYYSKDDSGSLQGSTWIKIAYRKHYSNSFNPQRPTVEGEIWLNLQEGKITGLPGQRGTYQFGSEFIEAQMVDDSDPNTDEPMVAVPALEEYSVRIEEKGKPSHGKRGTEASIVLKINLATRELVGFEWRIDEYVGRGPTFSRDLAVWDYDRGYRFSCGMGAGLNYVLTPGAYRLDLVGPPRSAFGILLAGRRMELLVQVSDPHYSLEFPLGGFAYLKAINESGSEEVVMSGPIQLRREKLVFFSGVGSKGDLVLDLADVSARQFQGEGTEVMLAYPELNESPIQDAFRMRRLGN